MEGAESRLHRGILMDHEEIDEQHIIERFVMGKLSPETEARFEEHFLTCEACVERLELAERFHAALRGVATEETTRVLGTGLLAALARWSGRQQGLVAAGLLVLALTPLGLWWTERAQFAAQQSQITSALAEAQGPRGLGALLVLDAERSATTSASSVQLTLDNTVERIALSFAPTETSSGPLTITLLDSQGNALWRGEIETDPNGEVLLALPAKLLGSGDHEIRLEAKGSAKDLGRYRFQVIQEGSR